jgi:protein phosphatase
MAVVVLPDPSLVVLIGAAGSGKSTLAARHFAPDEILSSDALRERVAGDAADQRASAAAFRILHDELGRRLAAGRLTVVDATNTVVPSRRQLVARANAAGIPSVAIVLDLPPAIIHARNAARERVVAADVVDRQLAHVTTTLEAGRLQREGFDSVVVLRTPQDVDALSVIRGRAPGG